jgi:hypothetical protein
MVVVIEAPNDKTVISLMLKVGSTGKLKYIRLPFLIESNSMGLTNLNQFDKIMLLCIIMTIIVVVLLCIEMSIESSTLQRLSIHY